MSMPVFVAAGAKANATTGTAVVALPAGLSNGDIVILVAETVSAGSVSITANGSIGTWNAVSGSPITVTGGEKLYVWWGRWSSGATGPTLQAGSDHFCAGTVGYTGVILNDSEVINVAGTGTETTVDNSFSFATGLSTTRINCMCICVASILRDSNTASVPVMSDANLASLASRLRPGGSVYVDDAPPPIPACPGSHRSRSWPRTA